MIIEVDSLGGVDGEAHKMVLNAVLEALDAEMGFLVTIKISDEVGKVTGSVKPGFEELATRLGPMILRQIADAIEGGGTSYGKGSEVSGSGWH